MSQSRPGAQEIADILEDALAEWKLSHEQLARLLDCSKESVENWLRKKCRPRPQALRAIEELRRHFEDGKPFPPKLERSAQGRDDEPTRGAVPMGLPLGGSFAAEAAAVVRRFFESIAAKQFAAAWKCLARNYQERRWPNGLREFAAGYEGFAGLSNLIVAPLGPIVPPACRVFVYYEDMTEVIEPPGFGSWSAARLGDVEECCRSLASLRDLLLARGADRRSLEQVQLLGLFTEQTGYALLSASGLTREKFLEAVGTDSARQCLLSVPLIARALRANKGRFLIDQLLPVYWGKRVAGRD